jgi:hypothetical protein
MSDEYWDRIDFSDIRADFYYETNFDDITPERALATEICRLIPRGWWCSYGDLGRAYQHILLVWKLRNYVVLDGHRLGTDMTYGVDDARRHRSGLQVEWSVPWHRMRDKGGYCRSPNQPGKIIKDNADDGNTRFCAEGGWMTKTGGEATPQRRVDMCEAIRRGKVELVFV